MSDHYVIVADQGHLRFFVQTQAPEQMRPSLREVEALDFPLGVKSYAENDTDVAGRFQSSRSQASAAGAPTQRTGMSIDERLPMHREIDRRRNEEISRRIDAFLKERSEATWDFAAPAELERSFLEGVSSAARARLQRVVPKDLVHQSVSSLLDHFSAQTRTDQL